MIAIIQYSISIQLFFLFLSCIVTCFEDDTNILGNDLNGTPDDKNYGKGSGMRGSPVDCQYLCQQTQGCKYFSWTKTNECWLKTSDADKETKSNTISGEKCCKKGI